MQLRFEAAGSVGCVEAGVMDPSTRRLQLKRKMAHRGQKQRDALLARPHMA